MTLSWIEPTKVSVTTCLVVLRSRFYFWKNRLRRRNPRRTVMGTTGSRFKTLRKSEIGTENQLSELRDGMAGRTVTDSSEKLSL